MNLADLYRSQNREVKAKEYIDNGLRIQPKNGDLHYALGLWFIRQNDKERGVDELRQAFIIDPSNPSSTYGYSVALFSTGRKSGAINILENYIAKYGNNAIILDGLVSMCQDQKLYDKANKYSMLRKEVFGY